MKFRPSNPVDRIRLDYSVTNVGSSAWVTLSSSLGLDSNLLDVSDESGRELLIGYGPAGSEKVLLETKDGGAGNISATLNSGMRLAVKAVSGSDITSGILLITRYK